MDPPPKIPVVEQPRATSPSLSLPKQTTQQEQETSGEKEPFKEGELFGAAAELGVEDVERHPFSLVQYEDSLVSSKRNGSPQKENIPVRTPSPVQEEELELGNQGD